MATNTSTAEGTAAQAPMSLRERLAGWREIMQTANPPATLPLDTVGKWLVMTRAAVFPMTLWSGTIGAAAGGRVRRARRRRRRHRLDRRRAGGRRPRPRPRRQQPDQRLLRHDRRGRHGGLRPRAVRAASGAVGLGHARPRCATRSSRLTVDRRPDHARAGGAQSAAAAGHRLRPGRPVPVASSTSRRRSTSSATAWASWTSS